MVWQVTHSRERCQCNEARSMKSTALAAEKRLAKGSLGELAAGFSGLANLSWAKETPLPVSSRVAVKPIERRVVMA